MAAKLFIQFVLILTLTACSTLTPADAPIPTYTLDANTPTTEPPTATVILPTGTAVPTPTEIKPIGKILTVEEKIPASGSGEFTVITDKIQNTLLKEGDIYGWKFGSEIATCKIDGLTATLPRPDEITSADGTVLTYQGDEIDGLSKYSDGVNNLFMLNIVPLESGATQVVLVNHQIYQLDNQGEIVAIQTADFKESEKPTRIISSYVQYGSLKKSTTYTTDKSKLYTMLLRGDKMLRFIEESNGWTETGLPYDKILIEELPKIHKTVYENGVWKIKNKPQENQGWQDWAVANPTYGDGTKDGGYWLGVVDLKNYTEVTELYQGENFPGPMYVPGGPDGMTKQEITDYRFFKSNSSEDIILVDRYNCRVGQQFEYNNTQNKYVIMEGTFIYITQFARDRFGHRITIGQEFGWLEGKAVRLMKNSDPKGEEEIMTPFWSTLPLAELRSYLAADELNLSTAEDIFSWSIKKFWLLKKYPSLQTPDGSFIDPDATNPKVKDQIKQLASGQLSCHEKGIADKTCFGWNYNNLQLFIVNDPQKTRYTGITRLHYSAKDSENKTVITMNPDSSLYGIVQQLGPAYEDHYIANFIIMNLNSVLNPDQTKPF